MIAQEMHELDAWIAEHGMGWKNHNGIWVELGSTIMYFPSIENWKPTKAPADFADIKREIERRGWGWQCRTITPEPISYCFMITKGWMGNVGPGELATVVAGTEEIAGCLAFKGAVEATDEREN